MNLHYFVLAFLAVVDAAEYFNGVSCSVNPASNPGLVAGSSQWHKITARLEDNRNNSPYLSKNYQPLSKYRISIQTTSAGEKQILAWAAVVVDQQEIYNYGSTTKQTVGKLNSVLGYDSQPVAACPGMLMSKGNSRENKVDLFWQAPQSGCVFIEAAVVSDGGRYYIPKKLELCVGSIAPCCACGRAAYRVDFDGNWKDTPSSNIVGWRGLIGASHESSFKLWNQGEPANDDLKKLVIEGNIQMMERTLKQAGSQIRTVLRMKDIIGGIGSGSGQISVNNNQHLLTFLAAMQPSPDWFVGVSGVNLCLSNCSWRPQLSIPLYPLDAGIKDGNQYLSSEQYERILPIRDVRTIYSQDQNSPFYGAMKPYGYLNVRQTKVYNHICEMSSDESANSKGSDNNPVTVPVQETCTWSDWSPCSQKCGDGEQFRQRMCNGQLKTDIKLCNSVDLSCVKDCAFSEWSEWVGCIDRSQCKRKRSRKISQQPAYGGKSCSRGQLIEKEF